MSTGSMNEYGRYDAAKKTFTYKGEFNTPQGETMKSKTVIEVVSADQHIMTMHHGPSADALQKVMEITYNRTDSVAAAIKVKAGCGKCTFHLADVKTCCTAVEIDGKAYAVTGATVDVQKAGLCSGVRKAMCEGEIKDGKFVATSFELEKK